RDPDTSPPHPLPRPNRENAKHRQGLALSARLASPGHHSSMLNPPMVVNYRLARQVRHVLSPLLPAGEWILIISFLATSPLRATRGAMLPCLLRRLPPPIDLRSHAAGEAPFILRHA